MRRSRPGGSVVRKRLRSDAVETASPAAPITDGFISVTSTTPPASSGT
jgi:hypothetical protein